jgi:threonine dehydrogenase-like Zn-dependent dehydrogenase
VRACSAGGKVVLVGMGDEVMKLDMTHACTHEIDLVGSFRYANTVRPPLPCCLVWLQTLPFGVMCHSSRPLRFLWL